MTARIAEQRLVAPTSSPVVGGTKQLPTRAPVVAAAEGAECVSVTDLAMTSAMAPTARSRQRPEIRTCEVGHSEWLIDESGVTGENTRTHHPDCARPAGRVVEVVRDQSIERHSGSAEVWMRIGESLTFMYV